MIRTENSNKTFDVIIPLGPEDVGFLPRVIDFLFRCIKGIRFVYIITATTNIVKLNDRLSKYDKCKLIDENTLVTDLSYQRVNSLLKQYAPDRVGRTGWYLQQFLKMGFAKTVLSDSYYLSWDSDTLPLAPIAFFDEDKILYNPKYEYNPNYFVSIKRLIGIDKMCERSFISESMMFSAVYMRELIEKIEKSDVKGDDWIEKIIAAGDYANPLPAFSEFETYGNYCMAYHPGVYKPRHLNTFREAGFIAGRNISEKILREMSFDLDIVSFELFHQPAFPYNLPYIVRKAVKMWKKIFCMGILGFVVNLASLQKQNNSAGIIEKRKVKYRLPGGG